TAGALKRQAARFRVYQCERDASGRLQSATEITADRARNTWTVELANRKGASPRFARSGNRNGAVSGDDTANRRLIIAPGARSLTGAGQGPARFDNGRFMDVVVPLGEMSTDDQGRLRVAGGFGTSDSVPPQPDPTRPIQGFADSDNWFDDTADGPV